MNTIATIFGYLFVLGLGIFVIMIFIQTSFDLFNEMKSEIQDWFKTTKVGMWYNNKKNKVKVLTDAEYVQMMMSGKIKRNIIINK